MNDKKNFLNISEEVKKNLELKISKIRENFSLNKNIFYNREFEFFEPSEKINHLTRKDLIKKIKYFNQSSMRCSLILKHEINLKLLVSIEAFLCAIDQKIPLMIFFSARYVLELLALTNFLSEELNSIFHSNSSDWASRGEKFLNILMRARNSTSDPSVVDIMKESGINKSSMEPINITNAIKRLSISNIYQSAKSDYDRLSNYCHHNGSISRLFYHSYRKTDQIYGKNNTLFKASQPITAVNLKYPSEQIFYISLHHTVPMVLDCQILIEKLNYEFPNFPFSDNEISKITKGFVRHAIPFFSRDENIFF